ncbi:hypothetical protein ACKP2L_08515 [Oenococcus alcoholitolerans]|uniref:Uncharacterized protein n=1 Tax=Oenococcus alcoholitolerans TaxID=931074 RepID=A0ABR4XT48_9LACO|nr:hypothetical protein Q757_00200 [Oenococcus alcoholitolerans]
MTEEKVTINGKDLEKLTGDVRLLDDLKLIIDFNIQDNPTEALNNQQALNDLIDSQREINAVWSTFITLLHNAVIMTDKLENQTIARVSSKG